MRTYNLTVKHVGEQGHINIFAVDRVSFNPAVAPSPSGTVFVDGESGDTRAIETGTVYVMNAAGRTIETFRLTSVGLA